MPWAGQPAAARTADCGKRSTGPFSWPCAAGCLLLFAACFCWLFSPGRRKLAAYQQRAIGRSSLAASFLPLSACHLLLAPYYRPPTTDRLLLAGYYWPPTAGRLRLAADCAASHWPAQRTGRSVLVACYWPHTLGRVILAASPERLLLSAFGWPAGGGAGGRR